MTARRGISAVTDNRVRNVLFLAPSWPYAQTVVKNLSGELDRANIPYNASKDPQNPYILTDKVHIEITYMDPIKYTDLLFNNLDALFGKKELVDTAYEQYVHLLGIRPIVSLSKYIREAHSDCILKDAPQRTTYIPNIKNAHFNNPMTIVIWDDGTKTMVKCQEGDTYSKETGLALCIAKKAFGNMPNFNNVFKKWIPEEKTETASVNDCERNTFTDAASTLADELKAAGEKLLDDLRDAFKL